MFDHRWPRVLTVASRAWAMSCAPTTRNQPSGCAGGNTGCVSRRSCWPNVTKNSGPFGLRGTTTLLPPAPTAGTLTGQGRHEPTPAVTLDLIERRLVQPPELPTLLPGPATLREVRPTLGHRRHDAGHRSTHQTSERPTSSTSVWSVSRSTRVTVYLSSRAGRTSATTIRRSCRGPHTTMSPGARSFVLRLAKESSSVHRLSTAHPPSLSRTCTGRPYIVGLSGCPCTGATSVSNTTCVTAWVTGCRMCRTSCTVRHTQPSVAAPRTMSPVRKSTSGFDPPYTIGVVTRTPTGWHPQRPPSRSARHRTSPARAGPRGRCG